MGAQEASAMEGGVGCGGGDGMWRVMRAGRMTQCDRKYTKRDGFETHLKFTIVVSCSM